MGSENVITSCPYSMYSALIKYFRNNSKLKNTSFSALFCLVILITVGVTLSLINWVILKY